MQSGVVDKPVEQPKPSNQQSWVSYDELSDFKAETKPSADKLVIHADLYNLLGFVALASPYNELTQVAAEEFASHDTFTLGDVVFKFGNIETLKQYIDTNSIKYRKAIKLVDALQSKVDEIAPGIVFPAKNESKNTNAIVALTKPSPTPYLPLMLQQGLSVEGKKDNFSLRVFPSLSQETHPYQGNLFKKIVFSFSLFGEGKLGKKFSSSKDPETVSVMTEAAYLPAGEIIVEVLPSIASVHEEVQFNSVKLLIELMKKIGTKDCEVFCNLHFIDFVLHGLSLYLNDKITKDALDKFFQHLIIKKDDVTFRLLNLFFESQIKLSFISSLSNLFDIELAPAGNYTDFLLDKLNLTSVNPNARGNNTQYLLEACRAKLKGCDLLLVRVEHDVALDAIHPAWFDNAKEMKAPLLIMRNKRPADFTDMAKTEQKTSAPQNEFYIFGKTYSGWHTTSIGSAANTYLEKLPYADEILRRDNPLFNENLIDILKLGHPELALEFPEQLTVWNDFSKVFDSLEMDKIALSDFLMLADVAALMIAAKGMLANELCSMEYASRKNIHNALSYYSRLFEVINQKVYITSYNKSASLASNLTYPRRSAVDLSTIIPPARVLSTTPYSPSIFLLSIFDMWFGNNLSQDAKAEASSGVLFNFKDPSFDALSLAQHSTFFKNASRNGAYLEGDRQHKPLRMQNNNMGKS